MAVAVVASSCQKDLGGSPDSPVVPGAVPADFDWKTTRNVTVSVSTPVVEGATPPYAVIRIYSSPILSAENLAARGVAKSAMPFRSAFTLNAGTENLYVQTTLPDGTKSVKMVGAHGHGSRDGRFDEAGRCAEDASGGRTPGSGVRCPIIRKWRRPMRRRSIPKP